MAASEVGLRGSDPFTAHGTGHRDRTDGGQGAVAMDLELVDDPVPTGLRLEERDRPGEAAASTVPGSVAVAPSRSS